jgi:hypothetical protein
MENDGFQKSLVDKKTVGEELLYIMQAGKITETACNNLHPDIQRGSGTKINYWTYSVCLHVDQYINTMNLRVDQLTAQCMRQPLPPQLRRASDGT